MTVLRALGARGRLALGLGLAATLTLWTLAAVMLPASANGINALAEDELVVEPSPTSTPTALPDDLLDLDMPFGSWVSEQAKVKEDGAEFGAMVSEAAHLRNTARAEARAEAKAAAAEARAERKAAKAEAKAAKKSAKSNGKGKNK